MGDNLAQVPRLRVLQIARDAGHGGVGGAEILVYEFARRLNPERFQSFLCTTREPTPDRRLLTIEEAERLRREGIGVLTLDRRSSASLLPWSRLWAMLVRERIDVVHAHMPRANVPAALLSRMARVAVVVAHEHGSVRYADPLRKLVNEFVVGRMTDVVLAVSEWDRRNLIEHQGLAPGIVQVLRNGISPLPAHVTDVRASLSRPGVPLIGAVGRLEPVKGYEDLIAAMAILKRDGVRADCVIAGIGSDEGRLRRLIAEAGVGEEVRLLGLRDDVPSLLRAFDVAVMPSHSEGAPLAILEYMAAGVPTVATRVGGIPELISDGEHGLLVEACDPPALAAGLRTLLEQPELARRLGDAAQRRQRAEFDLDVVVRRVEELYLTLYARRLAGHRSG